jgi:superfamily I DNA/RNA helicase
VEVVKAEGLLARGAKTAIGKLAPDEAVSIDALDRVFAPGSIEEMLRVLTEGTIPECIAWLRPRVVSAKEKAIEYPANILAVHGPRGLRETPRVILGTIHSVKGGEADVAYLCPDLSRAAGNEWARGGESRDNIIRQMYVGMTRARESLVLCEPSARPATAYAPLRESKQTKN